MMTKTGLSVLLLAAGAVIGAPPANADNDSFNAMLRANGVDTSSVDSQLANVNLGLAICNMLNTTQSPNATVDSLVARGYHTQANANMWMAASVINLCPEMDYVTHYAEYARRNPVPNVPSYDDIQAGLARDRDYPAFTNGPLGGP
jgi:hypothetical protein